MTRGEHDVFCDQCASAAPLRDGTDGDAVREVFRGHATHYAVLIANEPDSVRDKGGIRVEPVRREWYIAAQRPSNAGAFGSVRSLGANGYVESGLKGVYKFDRVSV